MTPHSRHCAEDLPANEERDSDEWYVVKALVDAGFVRFAEPCIVECHEGIFECKACQEEAGVEGVQGAAEATVRGGSRGGSVRRAGAGGVGAGSGSGSGSTARKESVAAMGKQSGGAAAVPAKRRC